MINDITEKDPKELTFKDKVIISIYYISCNRKILPTNREDFVGLIIP